MKTIHIYYFRKSVFLHSDLLRLEYSVFYMHFRIPAKAGMAKM